MNKETERYAMSETKETQQIQALRVRIKEQWTNVEYYSKALNTAERETKRLKEELFYKATGIAFGSIVKSGRFPGKLFKVADIEIDAHTDMSDPQRVWISGRPRKKDGEWSKKHNLLFSDWEAIGSTF